MPKTQSTNNFINTIDECLTNGVKNGIFQISVEDESLNGRQITIHGNSVVNFGSCSYLGLEMDDRLKQGAIEATYRYGTQYSSSRAYSACHLYEELEDLFYRIFNHNRAILAASTTLAHVAAIPILVQENDLVILDHQVHGSVQLAAQLAKAKGTRVEMIRHNNMNMLEALIKENPNKYNKIWYLADGLYSMYGDYAPLPEITFLMEKYSNFYLYIDDAHGMSWTGEHGNGYVLSQMELHPKMVLTTSLAKGFGTGGGVTVMSDKEMMRKILTCGSSYTFSGPVQPPMLGASVASAKIHLSPEIEQLQRKLKDKIQLTRNILDEYHLPLVHASDSPIFYIALGLPRTGYNMVKRLLNEGFFTNIGIFPGVPVNCTGLRLPITNSHTDEDIRNLLDAFRYHFPRVLEEENVTIDKLGLSFKTSFEDTKKYFALGQQDTLADRFAIQHETTIHNIDPQLWDKLLGDRGTFDWEGCRFIEETFSTHAEPENNWKLHYLIIRDQNRKPILATYFTELLCKDDLFASVEASRQIEEIRKKDPYYLTSKVVMLGSLLSLGDHLFIDRHHAHWKESIKEMLRIMTEVKQQSGASMIQLRDFDSQDAELRDFFIAEGFFKFDMPDVHTITDMKWNSGSDYLARFSSKSRWHFKKLILEKEMNFTTRILTTEEEKRSGDVQHWFQLYKNVKDKSFYINTFTIPVKFFQQIVTHPKWEVIELWLKSGDGTDSTELPVAVNFCYRSGNNYSLYAVGLNYDYVVEQGAYRQGLYQTMMRAHQLNCDQLFLGMDAVVEKKRFGVSVFPVAAYVQASDNFNMELIGTKQ